MKRSLSILTVTLTALFSCLFPLLPLSSQASIPSWDKNSTDAKTTDKIVPTKLRPELEKTEIRGIRRSNTWNENLHSLNLPQSVRLAAVGQDSLLIYMPAILSGKKETQEPDCPISPPDNSPNILFEEQFYKFSSNVWSATGKIPQLDFFRGNPVCPSLYITEGLAMTNQSWSLASGLKFHVKIRVKHTDLTCLPGLPSVGYTGFYVTDLSGNILAGIRFVEPACPVEGELDFDYYHASSYNDHSGDGFDWPPYNGRFINFEMRIGADGYIKWYRDGYLKYISKFPINNTMQPVRIKLWGYSPTMQIYFDDIRIYK